MVERLLLTPLRRVIAQMVLDSLSWASAILMAVLLRYDFDVASVAWGSIAATCAVAVAAQLLFGTVSGLYRRRFLSGSLAEAQSLFTVALSVAITVGVPVLIVGLEIQVARSVVFIAFPGAFVLMGALRYVARLYVENRNKPSEQAQRTLIFGAGALAGHLIRRMLTDPESLYLPVGLIDDDPAKSRLRLSGVRVLGPRTRIAEAAERSGASAIIVGVGSADAELLREITDSSTAAGLRVLVLPLLNEILEGKSRLDDLRDIAIEDIIGRHPVDTEVRSIAGYLEGKRVLVTGAGGSIGSELCRQIMKFMPEELIMLDRDETALQHTQISIYGNGLLNTREVVLADIRDAEALCEIFRERRPEVVFHAAALKHLPLLEQYPDEAWKTNVCGTENVLNAAAGVGVRTFVNISTDKAANPTSALGHSKRLAERLTRWMAAEIGERYLSVRFGNVIGSRGSMLPVFTALINAGGPLTVTHPDATRYFMTIPEACQLVVQAGGIGSPGETLILDMGKPVRILDIAQRMIAMAARDVSIVYTGLRPGEKLHEELAGDGEVDHRPVHPKISHTMTPSIRPENLRRAWLRSKSPAAADNDTTGRTR